jgi:hypothetical protein
VHDVLKVARFLGIGADEIEAAVLDEAGPEPGDRDVDEGGVVPLLEQAIALFGWTNDQAASALRVTPTRVGEWRTGAVAMTLPELMAVAALIGLHAAGAAEPLAQPSGPSSPRSRAR